MQGNTHADMRCDPVTKPTCSVAILNDCFFSNVGMEPEGERGEACARLCGYILLRWLGAPQWPAPESPSIPESVLFALAEKVLLRRSGVGFVLAFISLTKLVLFSQHPQSYSTSVTACPARAALACKTLAKHNCKRWGNLANFFWQNVTTVAANNCIEVGNHV